jgi:KUP system potassium uptake protein
MVTFITTCLISLVALIIWRLHFAIVLAFFLVFGTLDALYLSAVLTKVPQGAWFTLLLAFILSTIFILWRYGKEQQWKAERSDRFQPSQLIKKNENGQVILTAAFGGAKITEISGKCEKLLGFDLTIQVTNIEIIGIGIFFDKSGDLVPIVYANFNILPHAPSANTIDTRSTALYNQSHFDSLMLPCYSSQWLYG